MSLVLDYNDPQDREIIELEEIKDKETIEIEEHRKLINSLPKRVQKTKRKELRDNFIKTVLDKKTQFLKPPQEARIPSADPLA